MYTICTGGEGGGGKFAPGANNCTTSKVGANFHRCLILKTPFTWPKYTWVQIVHTNTLFSQEPTIYVLSRNRKIGSIVLFFKLSRVLVRNLHPEICTWDANLHPGHKFGHENGVLRICTRVQICSYNRGGTNLFSPGCKPYNSLYILIGDLDKWQAFSITMLFKFD